MRFNKKAQDCKCKICSAMPKRAQEEMIGFVLIVILVAVIMLIFIGFSLRKPQTENLESYEVESFIQSMLQYTSDCKNNFGYLSISELILSCTNAEDCLDKRKSCDVLYTTLKEISEKAWTIQDRPIKGYELNILLDNKELIPLLSQGNKTSNYRGSMQDISKGGKDISIEFKAYS